jgi:glycogen(starch) synthase
MRVLFWSDYFWPYVGGIEVWSARLLTALRERGHEFTVMTSHGSLELPDVTHYKGIPVFRFPFWTALTDRSVDRLMRLQRQVAELKRSVRPGLIHLNLIGPAAYFHLQTADAHPAPSLISFHHPLQTQTGGSDSLIARTLRSAGWVNSFSAVVLAEVRRLVPEIAPRSSLIYHGLDAPAILPRPLLLDPPRLLCLGRVVPDKGFDLALEAFAIIAHRFPGARLMIASDGPARPALERRAVELNLTDVVEFLGWVEFDRMAALMNSATMVLMPSRCYEGFGLVALEAALMARPVVASRVGALPEVIADGQTGVLVDPEDSHALAEAIAYLLDHPEAATRMGEAARRRAQELFSFKRHVDAFDALYRRLIPQAALIDPAASPTVH